MMRLLVGVVLALVSVVAASDCPGGLVRCPDFMTCCELANKEYGCCPFPNAMCCKDFVHCCPQNMECDIVHQSCQKNGSPVPLYWKAPIHPELIYPVEKIVHEATVNEPIDELLGNNELDQFREVPEGKCPDGRPCPDTFTCCQMHIGGYGCCPFQNAQCCSDGYHCCPSNAHCNSTTRSCEHQQLQFSFEPYEMSAKPQPRKTKASTQPQRSEVSDPGGICPDGHPCPEKFTCCKVPDQGYGCCPYTDAVCCTDFIHCCPKGTNCNTTLGTCDVEKTQDISVPAYSLVTKKLTKLPVPKSVMANVSSVVCPDERYRCPDGNTCCELSSGAYGCCPMELASCCNDHEHCCPHGYKCVPGGCSKSSDTNTHQPQHNNLKKKHLHFEDRNDVVCPDLISSCPDNNTCCDIGLGLFGCCPMPEAACCDDKQHCCPNGYKCTPSGCVKVQGLDMLPLHSINIAQRTMDQAQKTKLEDVVCPDASRCPHDNTCCEMEDGGYGCCPMAEATCCGDLETCCPHGYWCADDGCERVSNASPALPAFLRKTSLLRVQKPSFSLYGPSVIVMP